MFIKSERLNFAVGILAFACSNSATVQTQIPQSRIQTQGAQVIYGHYCNLIFLDNLCDAASNVSITLDVIEHCKNMHANDPTSLLPCLTPLLWLSIASSYREKIVRRVFGSRRSMNSEPRCAETRTCRWSPAVFHNHRSSAHQLTTEIDKYRKALDPRIQRNPALIRKGLDAQFRELIIEPFPELAGRNVGVQNKTVIILCPSQ